MSPHENPYAAPQTPLQTAESLSTIAAFPLPTEFAQGAKTLLFTAWNPLALVLMNAAFAVYEPLGPLSAAILLVIAIRGYFPFCRAATVSKNVFRVVTFITAICYLLFMLTIFGLFSYREDAFRNTLLLWLIGNAIMMIGLLMLAKEYRQESLRKWAIWAFVFSLLLFASVLPLQTQWLGFEILHTYAAWYYFVSIAFYVLNVGVLAHVRQSVTDPYQTLNKKPRLPEEMEIPASLRSE